jgi:hypothetical protein
MLYSSPSPDMQYVEHKLVKNTLPSHHVKHDDTQEQSKWVNLGSKQLAVNIRYGY